MWSISKDSNLYVPYKPVPPPCKHHWHRHPEDGKSREIVTTGIPKIPVVCCHCGSSAHVSQSKGFGCGYYAADEPTTEMQNACCIKERDASI